MASNSYWAHYNPTPYLNQSTTAGWYRLLHMICFGRCLIWYVTPPSATSCQMMELGLATWLHHIKHIRKQYSSELGDEAR